MLWHVNTRSQVGAENSAVGRFVCELTRSAEAEIVRSGCELAGVEMRAIARETLLDLVEELGRKYPCNF
jgi:hypothetical protein